MVVMTFIKTLLGRYPMVVRILVAMALLGLVYLITTTAFFNSVSKIEQRGWEAGKNHTAVQTQDQILKNVSTANDAHQTIDAQAAAGTGPELYAQCLRSARNPEGCKRFLPAR